MADNKQEFSTKVPDWTEGTENAGVVPATPEEVNRFVNHGLR